MRNISSFLLMSALLVSVVMSVPLAFAQRTTDERSGSHSRLIPPPTLACDRNLLTSYIGEVTQYKRGAGSTDITIHTDWGTTESVTLQHPDQDGPLQYYMLRGQPFTSKDWASIEVEPGVLLDGMRAIAWVCMDKQISAVIDWRPL